MDRYLYTFSRCLLYVHLANTHTRARAHKNCSHTYRASWSWSKRKNRAAIFFRGSSLVLLCFDSRFRVATVAFFTTNDTVSLATALRFYPNEFFCRENSNKDTWMTPISQSYLIGPNIELLEHRDEINGMLDLLTNSSFREVGFVAKVNGDSSLFERMTILR